MYTQALYAVNVETSSQNSPLYATIFGYASICIVLQLCANSYTNCAINDTCMEFYELLEDIISKYFRYRDIPDFSYFVCNQKIALLDVTAQYTILPAIACS